MMQTLAKLLYSGSITSFFLNEKFLLLKPSILFFILAASVHMCINMRIRGRYGKARSSAAPGNRGQLDKEQITSKKMM